MQTEPTRSDLNEPMATLEAELSRLTADQRAMVIDFARRLGKPINLLVPDALEGLEYEAWLDRVALRSTQMLQQQRERLTDAGIALDGDFPLERG